MSTQPSEIPERVFTVCALPLRYNDRYIREEKAWVALLFVDRTGKLDYYDLHAIMTDRTVKEVMENFFMGGPIQWDQTDRLGWWSQGEPLPDPMSGSANHGILVSQRPIYMPDCRRNPDLPLWVSVDGVLHKRKVYDIYKSCRRLHRLMGCWRCPDVGEACFVAHTQIPWPQIPLPGMGDPYINLNDQKFQYYLQRQQLTWDWAKDTFKPWKDKIMGFTYIPPQLASATPTRPGEGVNQPYQLDFNGLEDARKELSDRSKAGIQTRRTKKKECTVCFFGGTGYKNSALPCDTYRPRSCKHGAWTTDQVMDATIPPFKAALEEAGYTMRQFEQVLAIAGLPFRLPTEAGGYAKWIVSRLSFDVKEVNPHKHRVKVLLKRTSRGNRGEWRYLDNIYEMWKLLPADLRRRFDEAPELSQDVLAVAIHMAVCHTVRPYTCMQGCIRVVDPDISHVAVRRYLHQVEVGYWVATYWREMTFSSIEGIAAYFNGGLPGFSLSRHTEDTGFNFNVYPRSSGIWG